MAIFLFINVKQIYTAMWYNDVMHQRILSENMKKNIVMNFYVTNDCFVSPDIWSVFTLVNFFDQK